MTISKWCLLAAGTSMVFGAVNAQTAASTTETAQAPGDIIVTAQRRSERLTDVPIAITAISGASLAQKGITDVGQLGQLTPGLNVAVQGNNTQPVIRGVGSSGTALGESPNVALYVDGVYIANQVGTLFEFADIDRVEVLKGPQGTLFGRNATGGAIQLITKQPSAGLTGYASASYGNLNDRQAKAYLSGGTDRLAASITGLFDQNDGYAYDVNLGRKTAFLKRYAARAKIRFVPTDTLDITLAGDYSFNHENDFFAYVPLNNSATGYFLNPTLPRGNGPRELAMSFLPFDTIKQGGVSLKANLDAGAVKVSSITAQRWYKDVLASDSDATPANLIRVDQTNPGRTLTQEVDLTSQNSGRLNWIAGAFYYNSLSRLDPLLINNALFNLSRLKTNAYAGFGEATYNFNDRLTLIAGLRYSIEQQNIDTRNTTARQVEQATFHSLTPRISLRYKPTANSSLYATFSQGFKSGTFNATSVGADPVKPEKINAYEIGYKQSGHSVSFSVAAYLYKYRDLQVQALLTSTTAFTSLQNAARATIYGLDADMSWRISPHINVTAGAAYNHAVYDEYLALAFVPKANGSGDAAVPTDVSGNWLPRSPRYTFTVGPEYHTKLFEGQLRVSGNLFVSSKYFWDANNRSDIAQHAYETLNGLISWTPENSKFRFSLYGNNLTNRTLIFTAIPSATGDKASFQSPRTYGGRVEVTF